MDIWQRSQAVRLATFAAKPRPKVFLQVFLKALFTPEQFLFLCFRRQNTQMGTGGIEMNGIWLVERFRVTSFKQKIAHVSAGPY